MAPLLLITSNNKMILISSMGKIGMTQGFRLLTEYECGRAQMAIEWVARSEKPIVEIGGRPTGGCDLHDLAYDLDACIRKSGESVRGFIMPDKITGYCCYGFYQHPWAVDALFLLCSKNKSGPILERDSLWIQGLLFGYSPDAIQRFISCASHAQVATVRQDHRTIRRVEIYGPLVSRVHGRNKWSGRCRKSD